MIKKIIFLACIFFSLHVAVHAQSGQLARQYYQTGEYEKAAEIYHKLYKKSKNPSYFSYYLQCLTAGDMFDQAEKAIRTELKRNPKAAHLYVSQGEIYSKRGDEKKADEYYKKAIKNLTNNPNQITRMSAAFQKAAKYDLAIEVLEKAGELIKDKTRYAYNIASLYRKKGNTDQMIAQYLITLSKSKTYMRSIQRVLGQTLQKDEYSKLSDQLLNKIQEQPDNINYPELLSWMYIQNKQYNRALRQAQALDLRLNEDGKRIYKLAQIAENDKDYKTAIKAYEYIINNKKNSLFALRAKERSMHTKRLKITTNVHYTKEELQVLAQEYESFLQERGKNNNTINIMANWAELEALYLNDLDKAIAILSDLVQLKTANNRVVNQAKLNLGDYYLMKGEIWEATLLYSQVDKTFKEGALGEQARFKNAKLSYYNGDFEWAQSQFDILKASTSKLISNDAIDLSFFITDNLGLDTVPYPMQMYARADLLAFQNKYDESFRTLDSIGILYPNHSLDDDILYTKAQIHTKRKNFKKAESLYTELIENFPDEIRSDNAMYNLAGLYEGVLDNKSKAAELYRRIFMEFESSTLAAPSRARYRELRKDPSVQEKFMRGEKIN